MDLSSPLVRRFPPMEILYDGKCLSLMLWKRENFTAPAYPLSEIEVSSGELLININ